MSALGYTGFDAGTTVKMRSDIPRGAALAKRIVSKVEVGLLSRAAPSKRDRVLLREERVQLSVVGKGPLVRQSPAGDR